LNCFVVAVEDPDPNGVAAWAAWAASNTTPQEGVDQWQAWQAAAAEAGYDIGPEAAAPIWEEAEAPPGMSDVEDDSALPLRKEPKVPLRLHCAGPCYAFANGSPVSPLEVKSVLTALCHVRELLLNSGCCLAIGAFHTACPRMLQRIAFPRYFQSGPVTPHDTDSPAYFGVHKDC